VTTDWQVGSKIAFSSAGPGGAEMFKEWGAILQIRPNQLIKYNLFTPRDGLEDKPENYCVTSYVLSNDNGHTRIEIIQEDNRPSGFAPSNLKPILIALKSVVETS
jgi:hypothetical protein